MSSNGVKGSDRPDEKVCGVDGCRAWKSGDFDKCHHHKGVNDDGSSHRNNNHNQKHGLHTSAETFFENAEQHHLDTYYAYHESLCDRWATQHNSFTEDGSPDVPYQPRKDLAEVAFEMAKLDMAKEYEAEHAVDDGKPLTEMREEMTDSGPWEREVISKVESLKTDIRRENRLALKDMGIYQSPEKEMAEQAGNLAAVIEENSDN